MNIALSILQGLVAFAMFGAGSMKLASSRDKLIKNPQMGWSNDFSETQIKLIGVAEVLGAVGLVAPWLTGILPFLTPIAALCLAFLMGGASLTHVRRKESPAPAAVLGMLALLIGVGRFMGF